MINLAQTVSEYMAKYSNECLADLMKELAANVVPSSGFCHGQIRKINTAIDLGKMQINPTTYRHISMPTFSKMLFREAATRYMHFWELNKFTLVEQEKEQLSFSQVISSDSKSIGDSNG